MMNKFLIVQGPVHRKKKISRIRLPLLFVKSHDSPILTFPQFLIERVGVFRRDRVGQDGFKRLVSRPVTPHF